MLYTRLQRRKPKIVSARFDQCVNSLFQKAKKRKLVARAGTTCDIQKRNRNRRRCWRKMAANLLVADRGQYVAHCLRQLIEGHYVFVVSQMQIESNTFGHVFSEPPTGVTRFTSGPRNRRMKPVTVELEELPGCGPEIWKFFLKRDHGS